MRKNEKRKKGNVTEIEVNEKNITEKSNYHMQDDE